MLPTEWGPTVWYNFHILSYSFITKEKQKYIRFFRSVAYILPCLVCTDHFKRNLQNSPPDKNIVNKDKFVKWIINIHNSVNQRLHKKIYGYKEASRFYHNKNGDLRLDHKKMISFLKLTRKYILGGISSIIHFHGSNVVVNYCYVCPCDKCRISMITLLQNYNIKKNGLLTLINRLINILKKCDGTGPVLNHTINILPPKQQLIIKQQIPKPEPKLVASEVVKAPVNNFLKKKITSPINENIDLKRFTINQNAYIVNMGNKIKVISKQIGSTPGIKRTFSVKQKKSYKISVDVVGGEDMRIFLWIKDLKTGKVTKYNDLNDIKYDNKMSRRVDIGISLHDPKYGDIFYVNDFSIG